MANDDARQDPWANGEAASVGDADGFVQTLFVWLLLILASLIGSLLLHYAWDYAEVLNGISVLYGSAVLLAFAFTALYAPLPLHWRLRIASLTLIIASVVLHCVGIDDQGRSLKEARAMLQQLHDRLDQTSAHDLPTFERLCHEAVQFAEEHSVAGSVWSNRAEQHLIRHWQQLPLGNWETARQLHQQAKLLLRYFPHLDEAPLARAERDWWERTLRHSLQQWKERAALQPQQVLPSIDAFRREWQRSPRLDTSSSFRRTIENELNTFQRQFERQIPKTRR